MDEPSLFQEPNSGKSLSVAVREDKFFREPIIGENHGWQSTFLIQRFCLLIFQDCTIPDVGALPSAKSKSQHQKGKDHVQAVIENIPGFVGNFDNRHCRIACAGAETSFVYRKEEQRHD